MTFEQFWNEKFQCSSESYLSFYFYNTSNHSFLIADRSRENESGGERARNNSSETEDRKSNDQGRSGSGFEWVSPLSFSLFFIAKRDLFDSLTFELIGTPKCLIVGIFG